MAEAINHFDTLSDPVLFHILKHLPAKDLLNVCCVSQRFYCVASDEVLWESFNDPFPAPSNGQQTLYSIMHPYKARTMRAIKIENNFRCSMKPIENRVSSNNKNARKVKFFQKILQDAGDAFLCMDDSLLVTRRQISGNSIGIYSLPNGDLLHCLVEHELDSRWILYGQVKLTEVNGDKLLLMATIGYRSDQVIHVISVANGTCLRRLDVGQWKLDFADCSNFVVDAQIVVYASGAHVVVWDIETGELLHALGGNPDDQYYISVALDANRIAAASRRHNSLKVWNRQNGQLEHSIDIDKEMDQLKLHNQWVVCNSKRYGEPCGRVWNTVTGELSPPIDMRLNNDIFVYKNQVVACGVDRIVRVCNMEGEQLSSIESGEVRSLIGVFDNGMAAVCCDHGKTINLIDLNTAQPLRSIQVAAEGAVAFGEKFSLCKTVLAMFTKRDYNDEYYSLELIDFGAPLP